MHVKRYFACKHPEIHILIVLTLARLKRNIPDFSRAAYLTTRWSCNVKPKSAVNYDGILLPPYISAYNMIMLACNMITFYNEMHKLDVDIHVKYYACLLNHAYVDII